MNENEPFFSFLASFGTLPAGYREELSKIITPQQFDANQLLIKEGTLNDKAFFIVRGIVRGYYLDNDGKEITDWFLKEGQLVAPSEGYYFQMPCLTNTQPLEDCQVLMFSFDDVEKLYDKFPTTERLGRMTSMYYSIYWRRRFKEFRQKSVAERYQDLLTNFPEIVQRVQTQYIASYLNTSRFHLSRIRAKR